MKLDTLRLIAANLAIGVLTTATMPAHAKIVTLDFAGTYSTPFGPVYGEAGDAIPYRYRLTYDTALNTNHEHIAAGSPLGDHVTTHDWYGYSASGLISVAPLSFGTKTWTLGELSEIPPAPGISAELWFDTDIGQSTPTRSWVVFVSGDHFDNGSFQLGGGRTDGASVYLESGASVDALAGSALSEHATITSVPEPATMLFAIAGLGVLLLGTRRH